MPVIYEQNIQKNVGEGTDFEGQFHKHAELYNEGYTHIYHTNMTLFFSKEEFNEQLMMELTRYTNWKVLASMTYDFAQDIRAYLKGNGYTIEEIKKY